MKMIERAAYNVRFGAMAAVARPTSSANLQVSCPAQTAVSRHLTPSRWAVRCKRRKRGNCTENVQLKK